MVWLTSSPHARTCGMAYQWLAVTLVWRAFTADKVKLEMETTSYVPLLEFSILPILFCAVSMPPLLVELGAELVVLLPKGTNFVLKLQELLCHVSSVQ